MKAILILLLAGAALAQTLTLSAPPFRPGAIMTITLTLSGATAVGVVDLQWSLPVIPVSGMTLAPGPAATAAGKSIICAPPLPPLGTAPSPGVVFECVASGGVAVITDGVLATITIPAPTTPLPLPLTNMLGSDAAGDGPGIAIASGSPFTLTPISPCDLNGDGKIDTLDIRNVIDQIEGVIPATSDFDGDGKTTVVDLQRVINASVGGICRIGN